MANLISLIDNNVRLAPMGRQILVTQRRNTFMHAAFLLAGGAVFTVTGLMSSGGLAGFPGVLGIVFLVYGFFILLRGLRLPKE